MIRRLTPMLVFALLVVPIVAAEPAGAAVRPAVTKVSAHTGPNSGGVRVTVTGTRFRRGAQVLFGNVAGRSVRLVSSTRLSVVTPAHRDGTVAVRVRTSAGTSSGGPAYTFGPRPAVGTVEIRSIRTSGGALLTVTGRALNDADAVYFGATRVAPTRSWSGRLLVRAPAHPAGSVHVRVRTRYGTSVPTGNDLVAYYEPRAPSIATLAATSERTSVRLTWQYGSPVDVLIRRRAGTSPPTSPTDGAFVAYVRQPVRSVLDTAVSAANTYSYAAFGHAKGSAYSAPVALTVTPGDGWGYPQDAEPASGQPVTVGCSPTGSCIASDTNGDELRYDGRGWGDPRPVGGETPLSAPVFSAISCPSDTMCMALDGGSDVYRFDGSDWSPTRLPVSGLTDVDCPTTTFCLAIALGHYWFAWNGESWRQVGRPAFSDVSGTYTLSCASASHCVAFDGRSVAVFGGVSWSAPQVVPAFTDVMGKTHRYYPNDGGLSCPTSTFCAAWTTYAERIAVWSSNTWQVMAALPRDFALTDLRCPSAQHCVAAADSALASYDGTTWTVQAFPRTGFVKLGCSGQDSCVAIGTDRTWTGSLDDGVVTHWDGTTWDAVEPFDPSQPDYRALSCPEVDWCMASTSAGTAQIRTLGQWSTPVPVFDEPGGAGAFTYVSCTSRTFCAAADNFGFVATFDGVGWSRPIELTMGEPFEAITCASASFCYAVDDKNRAWSYDGSWGDPASGYDIVEGAGAVVTSLTCVSSDFCMAVDDGGRAIRYDPADGWSAPSPVIARPLVSVRCNGVAHCLALADYGGIELFDGSVWRPGAQAGDNTTHHLVSLDCAADSTRCLSTDLAGEARLSDGGAWSDPTPVLPSSALLSCARPSWCLALGGHQSVVRQGP